MSPKIYFQINYNIFSIFCQIPIAILFEKNYNISHRSPFLKSDLKVWASFFILFVKRKGENYYEQRNSNWKAN